MKLVLTRDDQNQDPNLGTLKVDGKFECFTLELPWRDNAIGASCVPPGTYEVMVLPSTRFKRLMPRLMGVPGRTGILIHPGNTDANTEGCILVGQLRIPAVALPLQDSRAAFDPLFLKLTDAQAADDPISISILNGAELPAPVMTG